MRSECTTTPGILPESFPALTAGWRVRCGLPAEAAGAAKLFAAQLLDDYPLGDDDMVAGLKERFPAADLSTLEAPIAKGNVDYILRSGRRCYQQQALSICS